MADVVVFGVVAADVVLRVPALPAPGDHVSAEAAGWRLGGSSANVACGLSRAGHRVRLVGPVGADSTGDELRAELARYGVDTRHVFRTTAPSARALVLLDAAGERTIVALDGGPAALPSYLPAEAPDLSSADCVYVESYTRYPASVARDAGAALLVTSPPVPGAACWPADVVVGSQPQYARLAGPEPYAAVRSLVGDRLQWVVVTRGRHGADAYGADGRTLHADAREVRQVDATGAGDAFAAGLLDALLAGADMAAALAAGTVWGAAAVTALQSVPPDWIA